MLAAPADAAERLTLRDALSRALVGGTQARIAALESGRAVNALGELRSAYLPQVAVTSNAGWSNRLDDKFVAVAPDLTTPVKLPLSSLGNDRGWINVFLEQIVFDLEKWRLLEREELAAEAAQLAERRSRDDVAFELTRRYAHVVRLEQRAAALSELLAGASRLAEQAGALSRAGRALEVEETLARLHREEAELERDATREAIDVARRNLWIAVGAGEAKPPPLLLAAASIPETQAEIQPGELPQAMAAAPELRLLDLRRRMEELAVAAARAGRLPRAKLVTGYSHYGPKRFDSFDDEFYVGVDFEFRLFDGFRTRNRVEGSQRGVEIAQLRYRAALERKQNRVRELRAELEAQRQRVALAERRAEAAVAQQRIADLSLKAGRGDVAGAVSARERVARRRRDAIDSRFREVELWAGLQRELGRLASRIQAGP